MPRKTKLPEPKYDFGEIVYRKIEADSHPGMVVGYKIKAGGELSYIVVWCDGEDEHYACELTDVKVYGEPSNTEDE